MEQHEHREESAAALLLPQDLLADVFGRLPPRRLALSRGVCKTWRDAVDARGLLRLDLPHSVDSIILNLNLYSPKSSRLLSRPSATSAADLDSTVSGQLRHVPSVCVGDHCNGLLLIHDCVVNPATGQIARLPRCPDASMGRSFFYTNKYLAFDPIVSPYYEVFAIPRIRYGYPSSKPNPEPEIENSEWPPSRCTIHVFSSRTGRWEDKSFDREGEPAGNVADMRADSRPRKRYAAYWQGALYVHCEHNFVMRLSLSDGKYCMINPVQAMKPGKYPNIYLGRSQHGVYCAFFKLKTLRVWLLSQSHGRMEWVLKHTRNLRRVLPRLRFDFSRAEFPCVLPPVKHDGSGPWTLNLANSYEDHIGEPMWNSYDLFKRDPDSGTIINLRGMAEKQCLDYTTLMGFHPYEEIIFLGAAYKRAVAYNLNDLTTQELGDLCPPGYEHISEKPYIDASFVYTPCLMGNFPRNC